jgi:uncharacterized membrane protein HdeD (DUF308 family)
MINAISHYLDHWMTVYQHQSLLYGLSFLTIGAAALIIRHMFADRISDEPLGHGLVLFSGISGLVCGTLILTGAWTLLWWASLVVTVGVPTLVVTLMVVSFASAFRPQKN